MQLALRPYATAGVALVGAGVLAVAPLAPPMPSVQLPDVHTAAVNLVASPFDILSDAANNLAVIGANEINSPSMILQGLLDNWGTEATGLPIFPNGGELWTGGFIPHLFNALGNAGHVFINGLTIDPFPGQDAVIPAFEAGLQMALNGDVTGGVDLFLHAFNVDVVLAGLPLNNVLAIPGDIAGNLQHGLDGVLNANVLAPFLSTLLGPGQNALSGFAAGLQDFVDGNPIGLIEAPFNAINGFVNGIPGALDGATGLLQTELSTTTLPASMPFAVGLVPFFNYVIPELFGNGLVPGAGPFDNFNPDILTDGTPIFANFGDALEGMFGNTANILMSPIDLITELLGFSL